MSRALWVLPAAALAAAVTLLPSPAPAGFIVTLAEGSGPAAAGSTGNYFDVILRHDAPAQVENGVNSYTVELLLPALAGVTFRAVDAVTTLTASPYVFAVVAATGQSETVNTGL